MTRDIVCAECVGVFRLRLTFDGGECKEADISRLISFDGVFQSLRDPDYFRQVPVEPELGTIVWPNGADPCPDVLYECGEPIEHV